jgi:hypothetical protein
VTRPGFEVAPYRDEDEPLVLQLLAESLGPGPAGQRSPEFFRWKHLANPFGRSLMLVARDGERIIGLRAFLRWRLRAGDRIIRAVRAVDTATHPDHRGRGVFATLTREAVGLLRSDTDLIFNTPNELSGPGYLKMGWRKVGTVGMSVRPRRFLRVLARAGSFRASTPIPDRPEPVSRWAPAQQVLLDRRLEGFVGAVELDRARMSTPRDTAYLKWRFGDGPIGYRAALREDGDRISGIAFLRVRPRGKLWEASVPDLLALPEEPRVAGRLLHDAIRAAPVDHVVCRFPRGSSAARAARRLGFLSVPRGPTLVVNPLRPDLRPDPADRDAWALSLADLEIF